MKSLLVVLACVVASVAASVLVLQYAPKATLGSVQTGSEYGYGTTTAAGNQVFRTTANGTGCTLGSIIIASSSATGFTVWNATSTTDVGSTTIATFGPADDEGTYTFDAACSRGISIIAPTGFNGFVITTHR